MCLLIFSGLAVRTARAESPLSFVLENQTFIYNQERAKEVDLTLQAEGFTLIGDLAKPFFRYKVSEALRLETGVLVNIPFGDEDQVEEVEPVISLHYDFAEGWRFTAGTIDRNHPLHDAFFNDTLRYLDPVEQGFQFKGDTEHWRQDTWWNWEERETATRREKFSVGNYTQLKAGGFMAEGQLYWVHLGGQKNSGPGVFNNLSYGGGGGYTFRPEKKGWLEEIGFTVHYLKNIDDPPGLPRVEDDGMAYRGFFTVWGAYVYYQHWRGGSLDFNSPRGDVTRPGEPLAKGDPIFRARIYDEVGAIKTWKLAEEVRVTLDVRGQFMLGRFQHILALNVTWRPEFPLFEEYFKTRTPPKPDTPEPPIGRPYGF
ncbi:MAG: hypothetical protein GWM98_23400 [Nitrospinaceae bacterium]|nr:hypothetical protein [Nitrospinaceae bacterium]NIR56864.1 hypothetical protein [Nitrospinaceae bacterium]NIS87330.1 hypothetical protein [Nitrospinaceae bacterium]NIT84184.1 hypothetical protein [Nitrospinaceae bacterium]NIU46370.1 hypothetical protein [Nitrospinaceae bacterium]